MTYSQFYNACIDSSISIDKTKKSVIVDTIVPDATINSNIYIQKGGLL